MKKIDLTQGSIIKVILSLTIPIIGSSLLQFTYSFIDMLWVGGLGSDAVAAIGTSSFLIGLGYSINSLIVIGTSIKVAHSIGGKDEKNAKEYLNAGLYLNFIVGLIYAITLIILGNDFIKFFDLNNLNVERNAYKYLVVSAPVMFFTFFNLLYTRVLGSFGNNKEALKISAIGVVINIILDPIFIYVFRLGVTGAALATLIANLTMFVLFNVKGKELLRPNLEMKLNYNKIFEIIKLGFPMAFQRVLFTVVNIILAKLIAEFGSNAIAAQKIGLQIESITLMVIGGINGSVASFVGQNFGAKKYKRALRGYSVALNGGLIYAGITTAIFILFSEELVRIFVRDTETIRIASRYLTIIGIVQIFAAIEMISNGMFTGIGKPKVPATISIIYTVLRIPLAMVFIQGMGVNGIWVAIALSSSLKGITSYVTYRYRVWRRYKDVI